MQDQSLYGMIYRYFEAMIKIGFYQNGRSFPSAREISLTMNVSFNTARKALQALQKEGYLTMGRGRTATVIWDVTAHQEQLDKQLVIYSNALIDLYDGISCLYPSLRLHSLLTMNKEQLDEAEHWINSPDSLYPRPIFGLTTILRTCLGNHILQYLYLDIDTFAMSSYPIMSCILEEDARESYQREKQRILKLLAHFRNGDYEVVLRLFSEIYKDFSDNVSRHLNTLSIKYGEPQPTAFQWSSNKGRQNHYYSIASDIIRKAYLGIYQPYEFLPKVKDLAEAYKVSTITVNRTFRFLNQIKMTRLVNGRGVQLLPLNEQRISTQLFSEKFHENLMVFLQSFQILAITCGDTAKRTLPLVPSKFIDRMKASMDFDLKHGEFSLTLGANLEMIAYYCDFASVRTIYSELLNNLLWGFMLRLSRPSTGWESEIEKLIDSLQTKNVNQYTRLLSNLMIKSFDLSKQILIEKGLNEAVALITPIQI